MQNAILDIIHTFRRFSEGYADAIEFTDPEACMSDTDLQDAADDCLDFFASNIYMIREAMDSYDAQPESLGGDFWLTRNRHGAGYWDRGWADLGDMLTDAAKAYGAVDLPPKQ